MQRKLNRLISTFGTLLVLQAIAINLPEFGARRAKHRAAATWVRVCSSHITLASISPLSDETDGTSTRCIPESMVLAVDRVTLVHFAFRLKQVHQSQQVFAFVHSKARRPVAQVNLAVAVYGGFWLTGTHEPVCACGMAEVLGGTMHDFLVPCNLCSA
jgi:hypothetical protein